MSYLAIVSFDLQNASPQDYEVAGEALKTLGFNKEIKGSSGNMHQLPSTTYVGEFNGASAGKIRDDLCQSVKDAFSQKNLDSKIFVSVGGDWGWGLRST